jgi:hypothetical protein
VRLAITTPDGFTAGTVTIYSGASGTGVPAIQQPSQVIVAAGSTVTLQQSSALTAGAATVWAELWGY